MFPIYRFRLTIFRSFGEHISQKGVVYNVKVTSYKNGELTQVQSRDLCLNDYYLSRIRSSLCMILVSACPNSHPTTISDVTACSICLHGISTYCPAMAWIVPSVQLFKFANVISSFEILQQVLVVKYFGCNMYIREYRNRLIFNINIGRYFRFDWFVVNDIT